MDKRFKELLGVKDVKGVLLIADSGELQYRSTTDTGPETPDSMDWLDLLQSLAGVQEAEIICDLLRVYIRKTEGGYLIVQMGRNAPPAMVRLNCDLILPALKEVRGAKGRKRFFKR